MSKKPRLTTIVASDLKDLTYDPDVETHYGPESHARMAAMMERLKVVAAEAAKAKAREAVTMAALERGAIHVKDVLAILRWAENPRDAVAGLRALQLQPGIGPATARNVIKRFAQAGFVATALA